MRRKKGIMIILCRLHSPVLQVFLKKYNCVMYDMFLDAPNKFCTFIFHVFVCVPQSTMIYDLPFSIKKIK